MTTLDEMSARQLRESHSVDLDFISSTTPRASGWELHIAAQGSFPVDRGISVHYTFSSMSNLLIAIRRIR